MTITEEQVVKKVNKYRKGISKAEKTVSEETSEKKMDNVMIEEMMNIINQQRKEKRLLKPPYKNLFIPKDKKLLPYRELLTMYVSLKLNELKNIFEEAGEHME